ncbi:MAG: DUF2335 domain-containing protein [Magnetococcales bacterium]|nr:DUF2335 domain-containing protein [Magnetococcales bacterium]
MNVPEPSVDTAPIVSQEEGAVNTNPSLLLLRRAQYIGPIPPPQMLAEYEKIVPDFPERILKRFEEEGNHRAAMEREAWAFHRRGQWMALSVGIFAMTSALVLTLAGHDTVGGIMGGGTVIGLVSVFVTGRTLKSKNEEKP